MYAVVALGVGCSGGGGSGAEDSAAEPVDSSGAEPDSGGTTGEMALSPLDQLLGISSDPREVSRAYAEAYRAHAEAIEGCMAEAGFEWDQEPQPAPTPHGAAQAFGTTDSTSLAERGYGVASNLQAQLDGTGRVAEHESSLDASTAEGQALLAQLGACADIAAAAHPTPLENLPLAVVEEISAFRGSMRADPAIQAAWEEWSACMAERGVIASDRDAAIGLVAAEAAPVEAEVTQALHAAVAAGHPVQPPAQMRSAIEAVARHEQQVVHHDLACVSATGLDARLRDERRRLEAAFVEANGERLALAIAEWRER